MRQTKEERFWIEKTFSNLLKDSELEDCLFSRNGGLTMRVYLEKPSNQRREIFIEIRGYIAGFSYNPLSEETISEYSEIREFFDLFVIEK